MITNVLFKVLFSAASAVIVGIGTATPASADPAVFRVLSCSCGAPVATAGAISGDPTDVGIQNGLAQLQGTPAS